MGRRQTSASRFRGERRPLSIAVGLIDISRPHRDHAGTAFHGIYASEEPHG
jgi:hypothetical protein